ncbi:MAG TPA: hypothetical protein VHV30_17700 [Polyangiaceae bacterium]|nr:hypothetical protein [Polyangiaceae bacterium]
MGSPIRKSASFATVFRALAWAGAAAIVPLGVSGCSLLLDWNGYTGGSGDDQGDASLEAEAASDAPGEAATCPASCLGCCNSKGECEQGTANAACGAHGMACVGCSASQVCADAGCVAVPHVDSGPTCTVEGCKAMAYDCPMITIFYMPQKCCKSDGTCGCTPDPSGASQIGCSSPP